MWSVDFTPPAEWLGSNDRRDRRAETPARQAWRQAGATHARRVKLPKGLLHAQILAVCSFPPARGAAGRRDTGNLYPTIKAVIDGMVSDYGLMADDHHGQLVGPDIRWGAPVRAPRYGIAGHLLIKVREIPAGMFEAVSRGELW